MYYEFTQPETLRLCENEIISDSSLKKMNNLDSLDISFNEMISDKVFENLFILSTLHLTTLPISNEGFVTNLTEISIRHVEDEECKVTGDPFKKLVKLRAITIKSSIIIRYQELSKLSYLSTLSMFDANDLVDEELKCMTNLSFYEESTNFFLKVVRII
jgi:Leucine-rich repeat (LRR) protein